MTDSPSSTANDSTPTVLEALTWAVNWMDRYKGETMPEWREWADRARTAIAADQRVRDAAPALLEALETMLAEFGARISDGKPLGYTVGSMDRALKIIRAAEAAVAAAQATESAS